MTLTCRITQDLPEYDEKWLFEFKCLAVQHPVLIGYRFYGEVMGLRFSFFINVDKGEKRIHHQGITDSCSDIRNKA